MPKIYYSGDVHIREGGYFYTLDNYKFGYVEAMRVTACKEWGSADNCYLLEHLVVNLKTDSATELQNVLDVCGYEYGNVTKHEIVEAHMAYGAHERHGMQVVQIGAKQSEYGEPVMVNTVLRGNTSLRKYARQIFKEVL